MTFLIAEGIVLFPQNMIQIISYFKDGTSKNIFTVNTILIFTLLILYKD